MDVVGSIVVPIVAALLGAFIANQVAKNQIKTMLQLEKERVLKEATFELIDAIDSFVHISYRKSVEQEERQRLRRRILSLLALVDKDSFEMTSFELYKVEHWYKVQISSDNPDDKKLQLSRYPNIGFTSTNKFFAELKKDIMKKVYNIDVDFQDCLDLHKKAA